MGILCPYWNTIYSHGGVSLQNMNDFLAMENVLAIGGSWLVTRQLIADADYGTITKNVKKAIDNHKVPT